MEETQPGEDEGGQHQAQGVHVQPATGGRQKLVSIGPLLDRANVTIVIVCCSGIGFQKKASSINPSVAPASQPRRWKNFAWSSPSSSQHHKSIPSPKLFPITSSSRGRQDLNRKKRKKRLTKSRARERSTKILSKLEDSNSSEERDSSLAMTSSAPSNKKRRTATEMTTQAKPVRFINAEEKSSKKRPRKDDDRKRFDRALKELITEVLEHSICEVRSEERHLSACQDDHRTMLLKA